MTGTTVPGWKAGIVIVGGLLVFFGLLNWLGHRWTPQPRHPQPAPTVIR